MTRRDLFKRAMGLLAAVPCLKWLAPRRKWDITCTYSTLARKEAMRPALIHAKMLSAWRMFREGAITSDEYIAAIGRIRQEQGLPPLLPGQYTINSEDYD